eukprot:366286-Chlamydomonas_euryale.AAC.4
MLAILQAENVLLTSWAWAYLVDFAPYKPAYLPADNPAQPVPNAPTCNGSRRACADQPSRAQAEFSYFFDTGGRRRCYIAPERFYSDGPRPLGSLVPQMDVFSLGCVIAELFLDGKAFLGLGQLLALRQAAAGSGGTGSDNGGEPPEWPQLVGLDPEVRTLIEHMVQLDPGDTTGRPASVAATCKALVRLRAKLWRCCVQSLDAAARKALVRLRAKPWRCCVQSLVAAACKALVRLRAKPCRCCVQSLDAASCKALTLLRAKPWCGCLHAKPCRCCVQSLGAVACKALTLLRAKPWRCCVQSLVAAACKALVRLRANPCRCFVQSLDAASCKALSLLRAKPCCGCVQSLVAASCKALVQLRAKP